MPEQFQDFTHKGSVYDRPNRKWMCGGSCEGCPCLLGPSPKGSCQAGTKIDGRVSGECLPRKEGDLWICNRPIIHGGCPCDQGPLPDGSCCRQVSTCQPRPTLRRLRGQCTLVACLATIGLLLCLFAPRPGSGTESPPLGASAGPLSFSHAFIESDCRRCHSATDLTPTGGGLPSRSALDHRIMADGKLCLECHTEIGEGREAIAFHPHTVSPETLPDPSATAKSHKPGLLLTAASALASRRNQENLACATCHIEHKGQEFDLKVLSNQQCQVCHQKQFNSFADGHPGFDQMHYPHDRRTRIYFDHYSHYQKHFPEKLDSDPTEVPAGFDMEQAHTESQSCVSCHSPATDSGMMAVSSFENACAKCHTKNVFSTSSVPVIAIPRIDISALNEFVDSLGSPGDEEAKRDAGIWFAESEFQDGVPWPMLLFLDPETRAKWDALREAGVDIGDLSSATPEQLQLATDVLFGFKQLFVDVSEGSTEGKRGSAELARRLAANGFPNPVAMLNGFPQDAFLRFRERIAPPKSALLANPGNAEKLKRFQSLVQSIADATDYDEKKRLGGELVAPFDWLEMVREMKDYRTNGTYPKVKEPETTDDPREEPAPGATAPAPSAGEESFGDEPASEPEDFGAQTTAEPESFGDGAPADAESFGDDAAPAAEESFGGGEDAEESFGGGEDAEESFGGGEDAEESFGATPSAEESFGGDSGPGESFGDDGSAPPEPTVEDVRLEIADPGRWTENTGGWFENDFMISYKSTGHADPLMKAWLEAMVDRIDDPVVLATLRERLKFSQGVRSTVAGNCLMCHTVDEKRNASGALTGATINWRSHSAAGHETADHALTRFDHSAHLLLADCRHCHVTETGEDAKDHYAASFPADESWNAEAQWFDKADPKVFHSNFRQLTKATCAACHNGTTAADACLQCHQYHFPVPDAKATMLDRLLKRSNALQE